jgi:hypothetical protein
VHQGKSIEAGVCHKYRESGAGLPILAGSNTGSGSPPARCERQLDLLRKRVVKNGGVPPALGYRNLTEAKKDVGGYLIDYYNRQRPHTFNDGISPVAAEENLKILSEIS